MLRLMFLMQLGDFKRNDTDENGVTTSTPWEHNIANALSHGGRTAFLFNQRKSDDEPNMPAISNSIFANTGWNIRPAGTHLLKTKGKAPGQFKEKKGMGAGAGSLFTPNYWHYGMDVAIGGVGNEGLGKGDEIGRQFKCPAIS